MKKTLLTFLVCAAAANSHSTESPFRRDELPTGGHIEIPRPHNVHTTIGIRYRF